MSEVAVFFTSRSAASFGNARPPSYSKRPEPASRARANPPVKRILILAVTLTVLAGVAGAVWWARQSLPVLDGEEHVSGLVAPAEVIFDQYGVPHVYAAGVE